MNFSFIHPFKLNLQSEHTQVTGPGIHQSLHDTSEGSEFLDDALREDDLIFTPYTNSGADVAESPPNVL